jgi:SAM-dependent methyltransferase
MDLIDIVRRRPVPLPWSEGETIPWNEPAFSRRMLAEHLSQAHDAASRRFEIIDAHVAWIHHSILSARSSKILDLGCGPGLYASRLAALGHACVGIDFSPASIAYARQHAQAQGLRCTYIQQDIRQAEYGEGFDLVMLIFGEFNVFRPADARSILEKANRALVESGTLLLEPHTIEAVRTEGQKPATWSAFESGLFSDQPHLYLRENFWDEHLNAATKRYIIVDALTGSVTRYGASMQAYTQEQYQALLEECGFGEVAFYPSLRGEVDPSQEGLLAITTRKRGAA